MKVEVNLKPEDLLALKSCDKLNSHFHTSNSIMHGNCYTGKKGSGSDLYGIRKYEDGDDFKRINRKATARTGIIHLNEFLEDRLLTAFLLIDLSSYMYFSSTLRMKSVVAAKQGAQVLFDYLNNAHRVGGEVFNEQGNSLLPFTTDENMASEWICAVAHFTQQLAVPTHHTSCSDPLPDMVENVILRNISQTELYIISDFLVYDTNLLISKLEVLITRNKLHLIQVSDKLEDTPPSGQAFTNGFENFLFHNSEEVQKYKVCRSNRRNKLVLFAEQNNVVFTEIYT